jgi:hypothetical protein
VLWPQNHLDGFRRFGPKTGDDDFRWFGLKTSGYGFSSLGSKLVATVSLGLALKLTAGFLVEPQNQSGEEFSGLCLKTGSSALVIWASKSP